LKFGILRITLKIGGRYHKIPFETRFHDGHLKAGELVLIYGIQNGDRFQVEFLGNDGKILFHLSARFGEKKVVRNANIGGEWGILYQIQTKKFEYFRDRRT
jgi:hypothetical protein